MRVVQLPTNKARIFAMTGSSELTGANERTQDRESLVVAGAGREAGNGVWGFRGNQGSHKTKMLTT